jgi:hypothetical protein
MQINALPATLNYQNMIDVPAIECPQYLLELAKIPGGASVTVGQLKRPEVWRAQSSFLSKGCLVRVIGAEREFDCLQATSVDKTLGIALMDDCPKWAGEMNAAERKRNADLHAFAEWARKAGPTWQSGSSVTLLRTLHQNDLHRNIIGNTTMFYLANLDSDVTEADLFCSNFWVHHASKLHVNDIIRVRRRDHAFDFEIVVAKIEDGIPVIEPWPKWPAAYGAEAEVPLRVVPIHHDGLPKARVDFLPATKWRVLGADRQEVSRDHGSQREAEAALEKYLKVLGMRLPNEEELVGARAELTKNLGGTTARVR